MTQCPECGGEMDEYPNVYDDDRPWVWCLRLEPRGCGMGMRLPWIEPWERT